jgi:hypothetical protein
MRIEYFDAQKKVIDGGNTFVDFLEEQLTGEAGFEREDSYLQKVDGAVSQTIARAIRDATQTDDPALQQEAASWLWTCCPDIAEQVELPEVHYDTMPTLAAAYVTGAINK